MSVSVAVKNAASSVGEGPHWDPKTKSLYYVDIKAGDVHKWDSQTGEDSVVHFDGNVSFVVPKKSGGFLIGFERTVSEFQWGSNEHKVLAEVEQGMNTRMNDAKCDASGRLWCGTMSKAPQDQREPKCGSLYSFEKDHSIKKHLGDVDISNGLAWSKDNSIMYYIDTSPRKLYAFDFDINAGKISNQRSVVDFNDMGGIRPDGMCIDNEGKLWVACLEGSRVGRFDPETGKEIQSIKFPTSWITSCCFGGENMDELYVTSICQESPPDGESLLGKEPLAGSLFKVTGLGVKGAEAPIFEG